MLTIEKIILHNFKRFKDLTLNVNPDLNILVGDNESGKSTILQAIDLVSRGSRKRVENLGLDRLFNTEVIEEFMKGDRNLNSIPEMFVELYFKEKQEIDLDGKNNSIKVDCTGIRLRAFLNDKYSELVAKILTNSNVSFPFEFYSIEFETFSGQVYNGYNRKLRSIYIDNSTIGNPYAMNEYINDFYHSQLTEEERINIRHEYKNNKITFQEKILTPYNTQIAPYKFAIKDSSDDNIETDIMLVENNIPLENKGTGMQCFIKTELALNRKGKGVDTVLIEEPENHLSYMKMLELINLIKCKGSTNRQLFISTHSDLIATRLNLKKCILFNSATSKICSLANLDEDTANFFIKAPDNNMLLFVLSNKVILVEGDAEFILLETLYKKTLNKELSSSGIGVISVDGKCFKRYLQIAKILGNKVAVITDNDKDYTENITNNYSEYINNQHTNISIFADMDNDRYTFEVCLYKDNKSICDEEFNTPKRQLDIMQYMLKSKANVAFALLKNRADSIVTPQYIQNALKWIDA